jgi:hypothetical protein
MHLSFFTLISHLSIFSSVACALGIISKKEIIAKTNFLKIFPYISS